ncbi:MAG: (4Fe-4S)-binding protein [Nitrospirae bacterium]|nr:(4Fe-4S)-binding protein [Nitrospirota bacterium]
MKELTIISGKGGTGKTVVTAGFASLAGDKVMADCDVDAADLHLILWPTVKYRENFYGSRSAFIKRELCNECGKCQEVCRFEAISNDFVVDKVSCEGCGVCTYFCPRKAIGLRDNLSGEWFISETRFGPMVHAKLGIAEDNSGKLVALVRYQARLIAEENGHQLIIIDGPPGIGCPVIASIAGVDSVLVVTEPTLSGIHDMKRVVNLATRFKIKTLVLINKYDLNLVVTKQIEDYCLTNRIQLAGKLSFDTVITEAMVAGKSVIEYSDREVSAEIRKVWDNITGALGLRGGEQSLQT